MRDEDARLVLFEEWKQLDAAAQKKLHELLEMDRKVRQGQVKPPTSVLPTEEA